MFVRLIFVVVSLRRKFFHAELFPNYGMSVQKGGDSECTKEKPVGLIFSKKETRKTAFYQVKNYMHLRITIYIRTYMTHIT